MELGGSYNKLLMKFIFILILLSLTFVPLAVSQAEVSLPSIVPGECERVENGVIVGPCTVGHFVELVENVANLILGVMGGIALLMFIYGGFVWITASGNKENVKKGIDVITNTVIAIAVILLAFLIVKVVANVLGAKPGRYDYYLSEDSGSNISCSGKNNDVKCGDNKVCFEQKCVTECLAYGSQDKFSVTSGHACRDNSGGNACDSTTIIRGMCPGTVEEAFLCCKPHS